MDTYYFKVNSTRQDQRWYKNENKNKMKLAESQAKIQIYNSLFEKEIKPHLLNYWKAIKELKTQKINGNTYDVLEKYGLGEMTRWGFKWDWKLKNLSNQIR